MKYDTLLLKCGEPVISLFKTELQKGIYIPSREGESIYSFLTDFCGISGDYISRKIKTVMIDAGPVDDIFKTCISEGGVCALSGAMPGIVGAMMRIGSPYAAMRESITVKPGRSLITGKEILISLKLFNIVLLDLGPYFLKRGILLEKGRVLDIFTRHSDDLYPGCGGIFLNGSPVDMRKMTGDNRSGISELVLLKLEIEDENNR